MKYNKGGGYYGIPNYNIGGFFRNTKLGRGIRDVGVVGINNALSIAEGATGTDFGFDEKYGYRTKFGEVAGGIGETIGSGIGNIGAKVANTIVPGADLALKGLGAGLESQGITQAQSGGAEVGAQLGSLYGQMNPDQIQNMAGMFTGAPDPTVAKKGLKNYKYAQGGAAQTADIEAEGGELILTEGGAPEMLEGGAANKIADNAFELKGKPHSQGGEEIKMPNGQSMVISRKYADNMKNILKKLQIAKNRSKSSDVWTSNAAKRNVERLSKEASSIITQQQSENGNKSNTVKAKHGMQYTDPTVKPIGQIMNPNIFPQGTAAGFSPYTHVDYSTGKRSEVPGMNWETIKEITVGSPPQGGWSLSNVIKDIGNQFLKSMPTSYRIPLSTVDKPNEDGTYYRKGGRVMKAQDGVNWSNTSTGPYSLSTGQMYSGMQSMPNDITGLGPFDRQIGYRDQSGQQVMHPEYQNQMNAMYGIPTPQGQASSQTQAPYQGNVNQGISNTTNFPTEASYFGPNQEEYGTNMGAPMTNFGAGDGTVSPSSYPQGDNQVTLQGQPGGTPAHLGQQGSFGVFNTDASPLPAQGPREGTPGENAFTESMGIRPEDMTPAYNGPEQMPEGYTIPEGYQITPPPPASKPPTKFGDRAMPAWMREQMQGLNLKDNLAQNASAYYNLLAGGIGALSEKDYLNYGDYKIDPIKTPKRSDMSALTAHQRQMMLTAVGDGSPQRRQAMFSSFMPQLAGQYAAEDARYNQRFDAISGINAGIAAKNMPMKLGIKKYNTALDAAPYEFMKEGISQFSNNALFNKNYEMMAGASNTSNYQKGQYTGGPTGGRYMSVGDRIFDTETRTYIS
jgi:hypothetical protein